MGKLAEVVVFKSVVRAAMVCLIPLFGFLGKRFIDATDRVAEQLAETRTAVRLIQQAVDEHRAKRDVQFGTLKSTLDDHEGRIRMIERR